MDVEQRARELLAAEWEKCGDVGQNVATGIRAGASLPLDLPAIRAIIAALTPPEGYIPERSVLSVATQMRRWASAATPMARPVYVKAAEMIEMAVIAARPEVKP